ncbi:hypothetical protein [Mycobacterium sp.]|uniref:hypothetical protein n=1 Tax=Mycobacterium sp. TaxID=1785 RepID=UPI002DA69F82|nr:hypothetical protein [Mycobacterium sp.]
MTTNFDTDSNTQTVAAAWAPYTQTIAAAWSSSPLGQPEHEDRLGLATTGPTESVIPEEPQPSARRALLAAALASGVIGGAALGVMLFDFTESAQPTVVVPRSESGLPAPTSALPTESRSDDAASPNPVVSEQKTAPVPLVPAPPSRQHAADVSTPPTVSGEGDSTVIVEVPIPDFPPLPETPEQDSEEPDPEPPLLDDPTFKLPEPDPVPPVFLPDLPLAPMPNPDPAPEPDPVIELPLAPSAELNPQPEPPSLPKFVPPVGFGS